MAVERGNVNDISKAQQNVQTDWYQQMKEQGVLG